VSAGDSSRELAASFEDVNAAAFVARLRAGGEDGRRAFETLVRATHGRLSAFVRRHLGDADDAQEVVQEVFLAVHKGLPGFQGNSKLTTWMYSLAHFKVCDVIAARTRSRAVFQDARTETGEIPDALQAAIVEPGVQSTDWDSPPDAVFVRRRVEGLMARAVALLKPPGCDVYRLRDVEGLSGEEVAEMLGLSHAAVRVQLHRARMEIVAWVRARLGESPAGKGVTA